MAKFIIIDLPRIVRGRVSETLIAQNEVKKNLVLDAGGEVVDCNDLGLIVECKKTIGRALDLPELVHVEEVIQYA